MQQLPTNTLLQGGKYRIEKVLGQGGFGITYLAHHEILEYKVAIKEFFMKELCERNESTSHVTLGTEGSRDTVNRFREKFLKEARNISKLNHPNIIRIIDVFEENSTVYYVMEYMSNGSLADKVKKLGALPEINAKRYILGVADALEYIHLHDMTHLDIKPANILINDKDEPILIDFGLSKQYDTATGEQTSTTPVGISEGYAPMEQYKQGGVGEFSPETDIYALGATFFKLLTGTTPPSASDVNEDGVPVNELKSKGISDNSISAICNAMESRKKDRIKSVRTFIDALNANVLSHKAGTPSNSSDDEATILVVGKQHHEEERKNVEVKTDVDNKAKPSDNSSKIWSWVVLGIIIIAGGVVLFNIGQQKGSIEYAVQTPETEPNVDTNHEQHTISYVDATQRQVSNPEDFKTKRFSIYKNDGSLDYKVEVDYPIEGNENLTYNIKEWIVENLLDEYNGSLDDPNHILELSYRNAKNDPMAASKVTEQYTNIYKNSNFVTYQAYSSMYYDGTPHGFSGKIGVTFRVKDGRRYGWDMMIKQDALKDLIIDELKKQYFQVQSDEEFFNCLVLDEHSNRSSFPFPTSDPWITSEGVVFQYGEYEIAAYNYGKPYCVIPLSKVQQYFTLSMKRLLAQ